MSKNEVAIKKSENVSKVYDGLRQFFKKIANVFEWFSVEGANLIIVSYLNFKSVMTCGLVCVCWCSLASIVYFMVLVCTLTLGRFLIGAGNKNVPDNIGGYPMEL